MCVYIKRGIFDNHLLTGGGIEIPIKKLPPWIILLSSGTSCLGISRFLRQGNGKKNRPIDIYSYIYTRTDTHTYLHPSHTHTLVNL